MFKNFLQYSDTILNILSPAELERIVENCFISKTKNYELLAKITPKLHSGQLCPFFHAIRILEVDAIKVMIDNYNPGIINQYSIDSALSNLWPQITSSIHIELSIAERKEKITMIAKQLFSFKTSVTESDLKNYAEVAPLIDFYQLLIEKKVDLSKMNLNLPQYEILSYKPLFQGTNYSSVEDVMLAHSYAPNKTDHEVRTVYTNLLKSSKIASDIIHFTAINLIKGDDLKITFSSHFGGSYFPLQNIIAVGEMTGKFTPESIIIHELGHYVLFYLSLQGMPFDLSKLGLLKTKQDDIYGYHLNNNNEATISLNNSTQEVKFFKEAHSDLDKFLKYEQAAKQVFVKAGELLGLNEESFAPYVLSKDFMLFLKDNSFIDLFLDNFEVRLGMRESFSLSRKKAIVDAYYSNLQGEFKDECLNQLPKTWDYKEVEFSDMKQFVREQYFPHIIKHFSLNDDKIWFLERIAELLSRAKDVYDCPSSYFQEECKYSEYYQETIVRYAELKASGIEQGLLDSFSGLIQVWEENISPIIEQARVE
jgi:hypothetical protein